jgi:MFS family permease
LFTLSSLLAGVVTLLIPAAARDLAMAIPLRFLTGAFLAGVYPVGMKIMATWTQADRGLGIGLLVGALTVGSASPHLINALGGVTAWQPVMLVAGISAFAAALICALFVDEGPYRSSPVPFDGRLVGSILRQRDILLVNLGYLGHMWELFAMWSWIAVFLGASFAQTGIAPAWASAATFAVIAVGGIGSLVAGRLADRVGRTLVTSISLAISGTIALTIGLLFGGNPLWLLTLALIWGFAVVADSAQFSACVSELCRPEVTGTALTLQTSLGFLLTLFTIRLTPLLVEAFGWRYAFAFLAIGPVFGIWAMLTLRGRPEAVKMAGGKR